MFITMLFILLFYIVFLALILLISFNFVSIFIFYHYFSDYFVVLCIVILFCILHLLVPSISLLYSFIVFSDLQWFINTHTNFSNTILHPCFFSESSLMPLGPRQFFLDYFDECYLVPHLISLNGFKKPFKLAVVWVLLHGESLLTPSNRLDFFHFQQHVRNIFKRPDLYLFLVFCLLPIFKGPYGSFYERFFTLLQFYNLLNSNGFSNILDSHYVIFNDTLYSLSDFIAIFKSDFDNATDLVNPLQVEEYCDIYLIANADYKHNKKLVSIIKCIVKFIISIGLLSFKSKNLFKTCSLSIKRIDLFQLMIVLGKRFMRSNKKKS
jgi:hypothetical protein